MFVYLSHHPAGSFGPFCTVLFAYCIPTWFLPPCSFAITLPLCCCNRLPKTLSTNTTCLPLCLMIMPFLLPQNCVILGGGGGTGWSGVGDWRQCLPLPFPTTAPCLYLPPPPLPFPPLPQTPFTHLLLPSGETVPVPVLCMSHPCPLSSPSLPYSAVLGRRQGEPEGRVSGGKGKGPLLMPACLWEKNRKDMPATTPPTCACPPERRGLVPSFPIPPPSLPSTFLSSGTHALPIHTGMYTPAACTALRWGSGLPLLSTTCTFTFTYSLFLWTWWTVSPWPAGFCYQGPFPSLPPACYLALPSLPHAFCTCHMPACMALPPP